MQDTNITFRFKGEGIDELRAKAEKLGVTLKNVTRNVNGTYSASGKLAGAQKDQARATSAAAEATDRASKSQRGYFSHIARTTVQSALINKLFLEFVDVSGQAIQQVDLMNNFPATMASMGQSTEEASEAMQALRDYVGQVGGNLGDATSYVTRFVGATGDVKSAVAIFTGLNNALIAGDSSMEEQRQSTIQFAQALERGKPDLREWRNLTQNMSFQLQQVAKEMGYVNANELGEALTAGDETMAEFTTTLTRLSTGMGPIAEQAMARMNGMQFSFNVLKNTMVQGLAAIINALGRQNIVSFFRFLTDVIQVLTGWVLKLISAFVWLINIIGGFFGLPAIQLKKDMEGVASGVGSAAGNAEDLADGMGEAGKEAKKLNKSLASFDQMNVLPEKTSGSGDDDDSGVGGGTFDPGQVAELGDVFGDISGGLEEASKWARIFAGVLAGMAAIRFARPILGGIKAITDGFKGGRTAVKDFGKALKSPDFTSAKTAGEGIGRNLKEGIGSTFRGLPGLIGGILGGLAATVGPAISGAVAAGATALGVSVGAFVAIIAGVIAVIVAVIYTLVEYWDEIVAAMQTTWENFTGLIAELFRGPIEEMNKQWDKFYEVIRPGIEKIQELFDELKKKLEPVFGAIREAIQPVINKIRELYQDYVQPLIDRFKEWAAESGALLAVLKTVGLVIGGVVLGALALVALAIAGVVLAVAALVAGIVWVIAKFVELYTYLISGGLWEDVKGLISSTGQWFKDRFNEAITFVQGIFSTLANWFKVNVWDKIVAVFTGAGTWFKQKFEEAKKFIFDAWSTVVQFFKDVWDGIVLIFSAVVDFYKGVFQGAWNAIKAIWRGVKSWFTNRWNDIKSVFSNVRGWMSEKFRSAWNGIKSIFSSVGSWFKTNVIDKIVNTFSGIKDRIGKFFKGVWDGVGNGLKEALNTILKLPLKVPSVTVAGKTIGGQTLLPRLARGGIVDQPTAAIIGEEGKEAIVPLENNTEWMEKLAAKINTSNGDGQPMQLTVQIGEEQIARKVIELINEKTNMSGRNVIYV